jgi:ubiquinone/menaquinone biosynthesis C-methylase UbiE
MDIRTWALVKLSDLCSNFWPANFSRYKDELSYAEWQFQNARWSHDNLFRFYAEFPTKTVIDLACGDGGKTKFFAGLDPRTIVGVDMDLGKMARARMFDRNKAGEGKALQPVVGKVDECPFRNDSFDVCISEDGFEHFSAPEKVLGEANRILKPGGRFLIYFEPYFRSGGPHLFNWIRLPWPHLLFSDRTMMEASRIIAQRASARGTSSRERPQEQVEREIHQFEHFINKITLRNFKKYLLNSPNWKLACFHTFCTNNLFRPFVDMPLLTEMFVSVFCVLEKTPGQSIRPADFRVSDRRLRKMIPLDKAKNRNERTP